MTLEFKPCYSAMWDVAVCAITVVSLERAAREATEESSAVFLHDRAYNAVRDLEVAVRKLQAQLAGMGDF